MSTVLNPLSDHERAWKIVRDARVKRDEVLVERIESLLTEVRDCNASGKNWDDAVLISKNITAVLCQLLGRETV